MYALITTVAIVLGLSALVSAIEAALFSLPLPRVAVLKKQGVSGSVALAAVREKMSRSVTTLVICTNVITIVGSTFVGHVSTQTFGDGLIGLVSAVFTFLIIIFGEIFPKIIGQNYAEKVSLFFAPVILILTKIFSPIIWVIEKATTHFVKTGNVISEDEIKIMSEIGSREGSIERDEEELIRRAFTLNDMTAKDIMTPRTVIVALKHNQTLSDVSKEILDKPYSRYPVFDGAIDKIIGVCQTKDLLIALARDKHTEIISDFMAPPIFVPEKKRVDDLLALFLASRNHMAIVKDEFGGTAGIVTFEDVLEQLVGEIVDESDEIVDLQSHARKK